MIPMALSRHKTVQAVAGTLRRLHLLPEASGIVIGLSGGPDSVALAAILAELAAGRRQWKLTLAHLHHGLRPAAEGDQAFVARLAEAWGLPLVTHRVKVRDLARRNGLGIEEAARIARYEFLERVAREAGAAFVAVGHHQDDQAETVLMNFLRGSAVRGLSGMPIRRPIRLGSSVTLVRPLLDVRRCDLLDYLAARGLTWVEDETNLSPAMRRNRVRHELLPMLEREFAPGLARRLVLLAENLRAVEELLSGRAASAWESAVASATSRSVEFHLASLRDEGRAVCGELVMAAMERLGAGRGELTAEGLASVWQTVISPRGGRQLDLPGGVTLTRRGPRLRLSRKGPPQA